MEVEQALGIVLDEAVRCPKSSRYGILIAAASKAGTLPVAQAEELSPPPRPGLFARAA